MNIFQIVGAIAVTIFIIIGQIIIFIRKRNKSKSTDTSEKFASICSVCLNVRKLRDQANLFNVVFSDLKYNSINELNGHLDGYDDDKKKLYNMITSLLFNSAALESINYMLIKLEHFCFDFKNEKIAELFKISVIDETLNFFIGKFNDLNILDNNYHTHLIKAFNTYINTGPFNSRIIEYIKNVIIIEQNSTNDDTIRQQIKEGQLGIPYIRYIDLNKPSNGHTKKVPTMQSNNSIIGGDVKLNINLPSVSSLLGED